MLVPMGQEKKVLYSEIAGAVMDLILNMILIPRVASPGAAIGTLAAEIIVWILQFAALKKLVMSAYREVSYGKIAVGVLAAMPASLWVKKLHLGSFMTLLCQRFIFRSIRRCFDDFEGIFCVGDGAAVFWKGRSFYSGIKGKVMIDESEKYL